ncbi:MAG: glycosyltransferase [Actinobacteria bacterium]|nr:glycosyltransferase [Actinomycetota bacterium]
MGDRPSEVHDAVASVLAQRAVDVDCLVVVNGPSASDGLPDGARTHVTGRNLGIPGGRNEGARRVAGDLILFLDDDARLAAGVLAQAVDRFAAEPRLGVLSLRIVDPDGHRTARRHVPRLRVGDPSACSEVTTFLGGASIVRRAVFDEVGWLPDDFFYAHEETSLAWRALDAGWRIRYAGDLEVVHPATSPSRHADYHFLNARNRMLLARRHLPWPVAVVYLGVWGAATLLRVTRAGVTPTIRGFAFGARERDVVRDPISWRTIARMTRLGRPPIV